MLAIMRVLHASGAADVLNELKVDNEGGSGMGICRLNAIYSWAV